MAVRSFSSVVTVQIVSQTIILHTKGLRTSHRESSCSQKKNVDLRLLRLDLLAYLIDISNQTCVCFHEYKFSRGIKLLAFCLDPIASFLGAADQIGAWLEGVLSKCLECEFPNSAGAAHEDGYEIGE